jgi:DNA polymerase-1
MSERLVVIDGKSVFYRGYYAMPNLSTKDGTPTGGVYGFAVMALEIIKRLKPNYVAVAWDKRHTNIRSRLALYPQYKGNRKPAPPDFYEQVPILMDLLDSLGWPMYEADDYEADDLMGAFAKQAGEKGIESYLVSSDLDLLQLVNKHTHIYTLKKGLTNIEEFSEESFFEKYGVDAHQWVDVKALKGDSSDNIPGVAGVGEKTALELISKYKDLDGVYAHLDDVKPAVKAKLEKDKDMAYLSQKLITLMVDAPIEFDFEKARLHDGATPEFVAMLRKLEFRNLLRQVESAMTRAQLAEAEKNIEQHELPPIEKKKFEASDYKPGTPRLIALNPEGTTMWVSPDKEHFSVLPILEGGSSDDAELPLLKDTSVVAYGEGGMSDEAREMLKTVMNGPVIGHDLRRRGVGWRCRARHACGGLHSQFVGAFARAQRHSWYAAGHERPRSSDLKHLGSIQRPELGIRAGARPFARGAPAGLPDDQAAGNHRTSWHPPRQHVPE